MNHIKKPVILLAFALLVFKSPFVWPEYEGEPIDIFGEPPKKSDRNTESRMDRRPRESKRDRNKRENEKQRKLAKKRAKEAEETRKELQRLRNENMVFDLLTFDQNRKLSRANLHYDQLAALNKNYLNSLSLHLNKVENQEVLISDIETEINILRSQLADGNKMLENRAIIGTSISHVCDRIVSLLAYGVGFTSSSAAATRIEFANSIIKEYLNDSDKTAEWVIEQVYSYSTSNYLNKNAKALLMNMESLYGFSKLLNDLENTELNSKRLYRETTYSLSKVERMYISEYRKLMEVKRELSELNGIQEAAKNSMLKLQSTIDYLEYEANEAREQAVRFSKPK